MPVHYPPFPVVVNRAYEDVAARQHVRLTGGTSPGHQAYNRVYQDLANHYRSRGLNPSPGALHEVARGQAPALPWSERGRALREYREAFPGSPENGYNINIPGLQDVIRIPSLESAALRRERAIRHEGSVSPQTDLAKRATQAITALDDMQDLVWSGLALLIPLVPYLPGVVVAMLGLGLRLSDLLNIFT